MKKLLLALAVLLISACSFSQINFMRGSVKKNADPTKLDIYFKANYTSAAGEYVNFMQFSLAIPSTGNETVTASAVGVNTFSNMTVSSFQQDAPYTLNGERVF